MIFYLFADNILVANKKNVYRFKFYDDYIEIKTVGITEINLKNLIDIPKNETLKNFDRISKTEAYNQLTRSIKDIIENYYENFAYYEPDIITKKKEVKSRDLYQITFIPKKQYSIKKIHILYEGKIPINDIPQSMIENHHGIIASDINYNKIVKSILQYFSNHGYFEPYCFLSKVVPNHTTNTVELYLRVQTGKIKRFGNYKIITKSSNIDLIENKISWKKGDLYSKEKHNQTIDELMKLKFLKSPIIIPELKKDNTIDFLILAKKDNDKMIQGSLGFNNNLFPIVSARFIKNNIFGKGEKLIIETENTLYSDIIKPKTKFSNKKHFISVTNIEIGKFLSKIAFGIEENHNIVFQKKGSQIFTSIKKAMSDKFQMNIMPKFENYKLDKSTKNINANSIKASLEYQPNHNLKFSSGSKIYFIDSIKKFFKNFISIELKIQSDNVMIKTDFHIAKIFGINKLEQIPKDKRIYSGGLFSKGFSMYKAETLSQSNLTPSGGFASMYYNTEIHLPIHQSTHFICFTDGVKIYNPKNPWFKSIGIGVKINSKIGTLSFYIAKPLNRRKKIDEAIQVRAKFEKSL